VKGGRITSAAFGALMRCLTWKLHWFDSPEAEAWGEKLKGREIKLLPGAALKAPLERWEEKPQFKELLDGVIDPRLLVWFTEDMFWLRFCTERRFHAMISDTADRAYYEGDEAIELFLAAAERRDTLEQLELLRQHPTAISGSEEQHRLTIFALWHDALNELALRLPMDGAATATHLLSVSAVVAALAHHLAAQAHKALLEGLPARRAAWANGMLGLPAAPTQPSLLVAVGGAGNAQGAAGGVYTDIVQLLPPNRSIPVSEQQKRVLSAWIRLRKVSEETGQWQQPSIRDVAADLNLKMDNTEAHVQRLVTKGYMGRFRKDMRRFHGCIYLALWNEDRELVASTLELANLETQAEAKIRIATKNRRRRRL